MDEITTVATRFVDLALKYGQGWKEIKEPPVDEVQVLLDPVEVVLGWLSLSCHDQDGPTGERDPVNDFCPFKVVGQQGDDYFATRWLDCAVKRVVFGTIVSNWPGGKKEDREQIIQAIVTEVRESIPFQPIQLSPEGDQLRESRPSALPLFGHSIGKHRRDGDSLGSVHSIIGQHLHCGGGITRRGATEVCDALVCSGCFTRWLFPKETETYGGLRKFFEWAHWAH